MSPLDGLRPFLNVLHQPGDGLVEWRAINRDRHPAVVRGWVPVGDHDGLLSVMVDHGDDRDFYVGAAPRERMAGGKDAVPVTRALWVDLDTSAARGRLARFKPVPSMIVHSGGGAHAYWELREPAAADAAEPVLRRLAMALEADRACAEVARVLRPPGSFNHKTRPARPARLIGMTGARYSLDELAAGTLSNNPYIETVGKGRAADSQAGQTLSNNPHIETIRKGPGRPDPLRMIPALEYVPALTGRHPGRDGKLECPFHPDEHPSFHAYPGADDWFCFQCERGGDIYTLAAGLTGLDHRTQFRALRQCLLERFRAVA